MRSRRRTRPQAASAAASAAPCGRRTGPAATWSRRGPSGCIRSPSRQARTVSVSASRSASSAGSSSDPRSPPSAVALVAETTSHSPNRQLPGTGSVAGAGGGCLRRSAEPDHAVLDGRAQAAAEVDHAAAAALRRGARSRARPRAAATTGAPAAASASLRSTSRRTAGGSAARRAGVDRRRGAARAGAQQRLLHRLVEHLRLVAQLGRGRQDVAVGAGVDLPQQRQHLEAQQVPGQARGRRSTRPRLQSRPASRQ